MVKELSKELNKKFEKLKESIRSKEKMIIAYSGGVDSALLAKVAKDVLKERSVAVFLNSETVPHSELQAAEELANEIEIEFRIIEVNQLTDQRFIKNDKNRCYYCRSDMAERLKELARELGIETIAAGAQATDLDDYRPGIKAFNEADIWHPFIEFDFSKTDIRCLAEHLALTVSKKPAMACLSSRVKYGQKITKETLSMIEDAEEYLRKLGFTQYRARVHDKTLRIEILPEEFEKFMKIREEIVTKMKKLGFIYVSLDLEGFRSGSGNKLLNID